MALLKTEEKLPPRPLLSQTTPARLKYPGPTGVYWYLSLLVRGLVQGFLGGVLSCPSALDDAIGATPHLRLRVCLAEAGKKKGRLGDLFLLLPFHPSPPVYTSLDHVRNIRVPSVGRRCSQCF